MSDNMFLPPRTFAGMPLTAAASDRSRVLVLPVPYDSTMEYRNGAREGPRAIIDASYYLELYDTELDREISEVGIYTLPEVEPLMSGPKAMTERIYRIARDSLERDSLLVMLGGEHSLTAGTVRAFQERHSDLSVLHLDAHTDLRDQYLGTKFCHACVMRRVREICPVVHAGIRALSLEERDYMSRQGIKPFYAEAFTDPESVADIVSALSAHVYISIDLDVLDPSIMPAVGTPEPGGLSWQQLLELLRAVTGSRQVVGFDLMELCPREGPNACAFLAAKLAYKLMGYTLFRPQGG